MEDFECRPTAEPAPEETGKVSRIPLIPTLIGLGGAPLALASGGF